AGRRCGRWPEFIPASSRRSKRETTTFLPHRRPGYRRPKRFGYLREPGSAGEAKAMSFPTVIVIGGGLACLASAVALAEAGWRVQLLEKRPFLGGRGTTYLLPDGSHVDNCQHVTLGCCTNLADFYRRVGADGKIRFYDRLYFVDKRGRRASVRAAALPPPLHMAPSFLFFGALTWADKREIARAMLAIARA